MDIMGYISNILFQLAIIYHFQDIMGYIYIPQYIPMDILIKKSSRGYHGDMGFDPTT